eukprot:1032097-Rhodomonas_salina.7
MQTRHWAQLELHSDTTWRLAAACGWEQPEKGSQPLAKLTEVRPYSFRQSQWRKERNTSSQLRVQPGIEEPDSPFPVEARGCHFYWGPRRGFEPRLTVKLEEQRGRRKGGGEEATPPPGACARGRLSPPSSDTMRRERGDDHESGGGGEGTREETSHGQGVGQSEQEHWRGKEAGGGGYLDDISELFVREERKERGDAEGV